MKETQSGQALLLVLLSIGVIITVALSVVSRSVTDISVTKQDEQSLRAFSAAEAGVEEILKDPIASLQTGGHTETANVSNTPTNQTSYTARLDSYPANRREFVYPSELSSGDTATVWLADHASDNSLDCTGGRTCFTGSNIKMCWGKTGTGITQPAIALGVMYEDTGPGSPLKFAYAAYDPVGSRRSNNKFSGNGFGSISSNQSGADTFGGLSFANCATLNLGSGGLGLPSGVISGRRLRAVTTMFLYNTAPTIFGVTELPADLPLQGRSIESTGAAGEAIRKVQVYALYPEVPTMFQSAIFSPPGVVK